MAKVRVYALAKEAGMDSKEMAEKLMAMGYDVKSHSSTLEDEVADEVRQKLGLIETTTERKRIQAENGRPTIIRRRTKQVVPEVVEKEEPAPAVEAAREEIAEAVPAQAEAPAPKEEVAPVAKGAAALPVSV